MTRPPALLLALLALFVAGPAAAQTAADSARADLSLLADADAARTFGAGPGGALDPARPTIHEFVGFAPGAPEAADLFYGNEPLARFEQALVRATASPSTP